MIRRYGKWHYWKYLCGKRGKMTHPWFYCNTHLNALLYKLVHIHRDTHRQTIGFRFALTQCDIITVRVLVIKIGDFIQNVYNKNNYNPLSRQEYMLFDFRLIFYFVHSFCISSLFYSKTCKVWMYVSLRTSKTISIKLSTYTLLPIKCHKHKQSILAIFSLMLVLGIVMFSSCWCYFLTCNFFPFFVRSIRRIWQSVSRIVHTNWSFGGETIYSPTHTKNK